MMRSVALVAALGLGLVACDSGTDPDGDAAEIRLMHAQSGAPAVDLSADGRPIVQGVAYSQTSAFRPVEAGPTQLELGAARTALRKVATANLQAGRRYTVLFSAAGDSGGIMVVPDTASGLPVDQPGQEIPDTGAIPGENKVKLRVIHTAQDAPPLDVYLTEADASLEGATRLIEPFVYGQGQSPQFPGYVERDPGEWRVRFTADGTSDVLLDTGPIPLAAGRVSSVIVFSSDSTGLGVAVLRER